MYLLAMVCLHPCSFFFFLFFNGASRSSLNAAEFSANGTLVATAQIRRIFFQAFCVNGNIIMLAVLSLKNKLIKSITLGDVGCYYFILLTFLRCLSFGNTLCSRAGGCWPQCRDSPIYILVILQRFITPLQLFPGFPTALLPDTAQGPPGQGKGPGSPREQAEQPRVFDRRDCHCRVQHWPEKWHKLVVDQRAVAQGFSTGVWTGRKDWTSCIG